MYSLPYVALGGAIGASLRYLVSLAVLRLPPMGFPVATLFVNVAGSFAMGIVAAYVAKQDIGLWAPFLMTGVLGGFTTFSAFSLETFRLIERGEVLVAGANVCLSVFLCIGAVIAGYVVARGTAA